jgi:HK97 family phage portal protein
MLDKIRNVFNRSPSGDSKNAVSLTDTFSYLQSLGLDVSGLRDNNSVTETTYFICLRHLSETMAKMPWEKRKISKQKGKEKDFDGKISKVLNLRPNPYQSASTFWATVEINKLHYGNAYVYMEYDRAGKIKYLWQLPSQEVQVWIDNEGVIGRENALWYIWTDSRTGKQYSFSPKELIHIKTLMSFDGLTGLATKDILKTQLETSKSSTDFLNKLYKNNMFGSKIAVHYDGQLEKKNEVAIAESLERFSTSTNTGKFIPMPAGMKAQVLDMKLADAQFFENNKFTVLQVAAAFGIKPNVINDYDKSSYSNSETQQIDFFVNTLQPLFNAYEQELSYKLLSHFEMEKGVRLEINEKVLFKMDSQTQAEVYTKYLSNFGMTPNEFREAVGLPYIEGGDILIGNGNAISIKDVGKQYQTVKGGEE